MTIHEGQPRKRARAQAEPVSQPVVEISQPVAGQAVEDLSARLARTRRERNAGFATAAVLGTALVFGGGIMLGRSLDGSPASSFSPNATSQAEGKTPLPSEAAGSASPEVTASPEPTATADVSGELNAESIIGLVGRDEYSKNPEHWGPIKDANDKVIGGVMTPEPNGLNSIVEVTGVGQAYLDAKVNGEHQAIAIILPDGETFPVRGISIYPTDSDKDRAFDGALDLENRTQPGVYVVEVCDTMQALPENKQDLSNPAQWEAEKISSDEAAKRFGKDDWSLNPENWTSTPDGYGQILKVNPNGLNSVIFTDGAVAQAYWDAKVEGEHQAIAITLGVGVEVPVRGATVYAGVPQGMETAAVEYAFKQAVNLEIEEQPEVFVGMVCKTAQAKAEGAVLPTEAPIYTAEPTAKPDRTPKPEATPRPTAQADRTPRPTQKPERTPKPTPETPWYADNIAELKGTGAETKLSPDGGLVIHSDSVISIQVDKGEKAYYWNGTAAVWAKGPKTIQAQDATVYHV